MKDLAIFEKKGTLYADSRDIAKMIGKDHADLMKSIRQYTEYLNEGEISCVDFFIESSYCDAKGESRPCIF